MGVYNYVRLTPINSEHRYALQMLVRNEDESTSDVFVGGPGPHRKGVETQ